MEEKMMEELNHSAQVFTELLERAETQLPASERVHIKELQKLVENLRVKLLEQEVREKYPCVKLDPELIALVGTESKISLEEEKIEIRRTLERKAG